MIHRQTSTPYHPQENVIVEACNNVLENVLTKVYNVTRDDWDECVPIVL